MRGRGQFSAQAVFQNLAGGAQGNGRDEDHIVRDHPFGHLAFVELQQLVALQRVAFALDHDQQRPFVPLRVGAGDAGGHGHGRVGHGDVFQFDGADPFAAGLDHVLGAVGDLDVAVGVDGDHVARGKPAVLQWAGRLAAVVVARNPRPAHQQVAGGFSVPRQVGAVAVYHPHIHPENRPPLLDLNGKLRCFI